MIPSDFATNLDRFWSKVDRSGSCWLWTGETNNHGYGRFAFWHGSGRTRVFAHRMVLKLTGASLEDSDVVMHSCDNPPCVNPAHLSIGTQLDNIRDAAVKKRLDMSGLALGQRLSARELRECSTGERAALLRSRQEVSA
jgi:hypothetical protein